MTHALAFLFGTVFFLIVLLDAFQTIILPRRPSGRLRITRMFFMVTWRPWATIASRLPRKAREQAFSIYGPLALLILIGLWAVLLMSAFGLIYFGLGAPFTTSMPPVNSLGRLRECLYVSGTTLFTLGLGDVTPNSHLARALLVFEAGVGLGFVALVIGYVPVLYGAFSKREVVIALLDSRAGSPPTAGELLLRHNFDGGQAALTELLAEWERWCGEILESHISYPILCYYRSQHDNQSWMSSITAVLDTCALLITTIEGESTRQAQLTFAVARHALVDLGHVFTLEPKEEAYRRSAPARLPEEEFSKLCGVLSKTGFQLCSSNDTRARLAALRLLYEPHAEALADFLRLDLPLWMPPPRDPKRKPDLWTQVADLRTPLAIRNHQGLDGDMSQQVVSHRVFDDAHE